MRALVLIAGCLAASVDAACVNTLERDAPDARYELNGGLATDTHTNLMWLRCPQGTVWQADNNRCGLDESNATQSFTWGEALTLAANSAAEGYNDWRLPNKNELASLVDLGCSGPALNNTIFTSGSTGYWTSTPWRREAGKAWHIDFTTGSLISRGIDNTFTVRLVRDAD